MVARTPGGREVASSSLVSQTRLCYNILRCQGVAQLVARSVRDAEVVSSSLITQTKTYKIDKLTISCYNYSISTFSIARKLIYVPTYLEEVMLCTEE